jgi:hypothetical protein
MPKSYSQCCGGQSARCQAPLPHRLIPPPIKRARILVDCVVAIVSSVKFYLRARDFQDRTHASVGRAWRRVAVVRHFRCGQFCPRRWASLPRHVSRPAEDGQLFKLLPAPHRTNPLPMEGSIIATEYCALCRGPFPAQSLSGFDDWQSDVRAGILPSILY